MFFQGRLEKYLDGYLAKKGEMLARKEDIELLRNEVQVLTKEAESIKAEIGHETWDKQKRWMLKHELEVDLLTVPEDGDNSGPGAHVWEKWLGSNPATQRT